MSEQGQPPEEQLPDENIQTGETPKPLVNEKETLNTTTEIENMEVHHHPQVEKKNFKEYLLEGLMIFFAVMLGFFAENIRENITDNSKEKEYIISMIEDAKTDTANMRQAIELNNHRVTYLDSLAALCLNYDAHKNMDAKMYRLYRFGLTHPAFINPIERTIQQLKSAGGMRLIRKKGAADSIILYDDVAKKLFDQQAYYELYQNKSVDIADQLFNFQRFWSFGAANPVLRIFTDKDSSVRLINNDKEKLIQFGNIIVVYSGVVDFYNVRLQEMNEHAINLINTLQKEYNLKDE